MKQAVLLLTEIAINFSPSLSPFYMVLFLFYTKGRKKFRGQCTGKVAPWEFAVFNSPLGHFKPSPSHDIKYTRCNMEYTGDLIPINNEKQYRLFIKLRINHFEILNKSIK